MRLKPCSSQENSVSLPASCGWDLFSCLGLSASPLSCLPLRLSWPVPRPKEARAWWWLIITARRIITLSSWLGAGTLTNSFHDLGQGPAILPNCQTLKWGPLYCASPTVVSLTLILWLVSFQGYFQRISVISLSLWSLTGAVLRSVIQDFSPPAPRNDLIVWDRRTSQPDSLRTVYCSVMYCVL